MNYDRLAITCKRLIDKNGRSVTFSQLDGVSGDPAKPWRGPVAGQTKLAPVTAKAVFAIGNTSIPTESRGLAFDWVDSELLRITRHVCLIAAEGLPIMDDYKIMTDGVESKNWNIIWGQCLQPGPKRLLYVFGLKE